MGVIKNKCRLLRSSIVNFFNQTAECSIFNEQVLWYFISNNSRISITSPRGNYLDILNCTNSFYRFTNTELRRKMPFFEKTFLTQWTRIAFRGKSYRVKCFKKLVKFTFNFGYSHWSKFIANSNWKINRRKRQNYLVFTYNPVDMQYFKRQLPYVRFYNCYTMRGLRLKKQAIIRRFGKISQHVSILH